MSPNSVVAANELTVVEARESRRWRPEAAGAVASAGGGRRWRDAEAAVASAGLGDGRERERERDPENLSLDGREKAQGGKFSPV